MSQRPTTDPNAYRAEIAERVRRHAAETPCRLNPDAKVVEALLDGLVRRKERFGDYYCPCRVVTGNEETDRANICPCKTHEEEIARTGKCHCGLFVGEKRI